EFDFESIKNKALEQLKSGKSISSITDRVLPEIKAWRCRPLENVYPTRWMDAIHYKVMDEGCAVSRAIYNVLGINKDGHKEVLGMYISRSEGANSWLLSLEIDLGFYRFVAMLYSFCMCKFYHTTNSSEPSGMYNATKAEVLSFSIFSFISSSSSQK
ncbi:MAG: transposase, partial [Tannerellaceae bacterium]|nr:transposase [Tannerellaceae bacterium]